jgi:hypothetical protein
MTRLAVHLLIGLAVVAVAACEPTGPPAFAIPKASATRAATTAGPGASAGSTAAASQTAAASSADHPTGSPSVEIAGDVITVLGTGDKNTSLIELDGDYKFASSACPGTGVVPFVIVYEEFGQSRGTYVDQEFTVKNLKGTFYVRISGPPTCNWTVTLTKA